MFSWFCGLHWFLFRLILYFGLCFLLSFFFKFGLLLVFYFWWHYFRLDFVLNFVFGFWGDNFGLNFMFNFVLNFMLRFMLDLVLALVLNFMLDLMFRFLFSRLLSSLVRLLSFLWLYTPFLFFGFFFIFVILLRPLLELLGYISNGSPIFSMFFLLSSHFDKKSSGENLFIKAISDEIDGVNFTFEDDFEGARVVLLDLDQMKVRESLLNIFFNCIEVALYEVQRHMLDLVAKGFDLVNQFFLVWHHKLFSLLFTTSLHQQLV